LPKKGGRRTRLREIGSGNGEGGGGGGRGGRGRGEKRPFNVLQAYLEEGIKLCAYWEIVES
jgi:hypothetical protein